MEAKARTADCYPAIRAFYHSCHESEYEPNRSPEKQKVYLASLLIGIAFHARIALEPLLQYGGERDQFSIEGIARGGRGSPPYPR